MYFVKGQVYIALSCLKTLVGWLRFNITMGFKGHAAPKIS